MKKCDKLCVMFTLEQNLKLAQLEHKRSRNVTLSSPPVSQHTHTKNML